MSDGSTWELWRADDNGNEFFVASFACQEEADAARKEFEAKGHKQTYWVRSKTGQ